MAYALKNFKFYLVNIEGVEIFEGLIEILHLTASGPLTGLEFKQMCVLKFKSKKIIP